MTMLCHLHHAGSRLKPVRPLVYLIVLCISATAQQQRAESGPIPAPVVRNAEGKLPQDSGRLGLEDMLRRLHTTARMMMTTAHPDDEDGGMLVYESRGKGVDVMLMTLTRGDGGQNKTGSGFFDELGVLRTLELLDSDRYYGVKQRFSHVADFGFSKSAQETFEKWGGKDVPLSDMVRVIRTFRPDVVVSRFSGTPRDGHGNHQAVGILTPEAVKAAADPNRFPEQIKEGLPAWQVKKLYMGLRGADDYTVRIAAGEKFEPLGMSYAEFGVQGYSHQKSQNAQVYPVQPGPSYRSYGLVMPEVAPGTHENDFFDGIDTTLVGLSDRLFNPSQPWDEDITRMLNKGELKSLLQEIAKNIDEATAVEKTDPVKAALPLLQGKRLCHQLLMLIDPTSKASKFPGFLPPDKLRLIDRINEKERQFQGAANLALGLSLETDLKTDNSSNEVVPGQKFIVSTRLNNTSSSRVNLVGQSEWDNWKKQASTKDSSFEISTFTVPPNAEYTRPYWHRKDPDKDAVFIIDEPKYATLPLPPPPIVVTQKYKYQGEEGEVSAVPSAMVDGQRREIAVVPPFAIELEHAAFVIPSAANGRLEVKAEVQKDVPGVAKASAKLSSPAGWSVSPSQQSLDSSSAAKNELSFSISPGKLKEGDYDIAAAIDYNGKQYDQGFSVVSREDIGTFYYYQSATQRVSVVDTKLPAGLKVGYIMGAGDDIPAVLEHLGINVTLLKDDDIAHADLSRYGTIILGIRAYDTQDAVKKNNQRLLDFVQNGGTLVVQNNFSVSDFNNGKYTPYPTQLSNQRVSVEEAPVTILVPDDSVFHYPNTITQKDFDGWVQERGVNFMSSWDDHFQPLLACNDPGEQPLKGGMLRANFGKGTYIYTGYAFFRQLPYGVPGAVRLYVNLLSAGHEPAGK
jgi:LmbE family N-acetylglucosaminyl deacetylase